MKKFNMIHIFTLHVYFFVLDFARNSSTVHVHTVDSQSSWNNSIFRSVRCVRLNILYSEYVHVEVSVCIGVLSISSEHSFRPVDVVFDYNTIHLFTFTALLFPFFSQTHTSSSPRYNWIMRLTSLLLHTQLETRLPRLNVALTTAHIFCSICLTLHLCNAVSVFIFVSF